MKYLGVTLLVKRLLRLQFFLFIICLVIAFVSKSEQIFAASKGIALALLISFISLFIARYLDKTKDARQFFILMIFLEIIKWVAVVLGSVFLFKTNITALGFILGFISAYLAYFFLWTEG